MINKEAITERLGLIFAIADNDEPKQAKGEDEATFPKIMRLATEALALLKEQPPASGLTKRLRLNFSVGKIFKTQWPQLHFRELIKTDVLELCDCLDASEASRKELVKASKNLSVVCQKIGLTDDQNMRDKLAQSVVRIEAAIENYGRRANKQGKAGEERQENEQFNRTKGKSSKVEGFVREGNQPYD